MKIFMFQFLFWSFWLCPLSTSFVLITAKILMVQRCKMWNNNDSPKLLNHKFYQLNIFNGTQCQSSSSNGEKKIWNLKTIFSKNAIYTEMRLIVVAIDMIRWEKKNLTTIDWVIKLISEQLQSINNNIDTSKQIYFEIELFYKIESNAFWLKYL